MPKGWTLRQALSLDEDLHGVKGFLEIAEDARIGDDLRMSMWLRSTDPTFVLAGDDPQVAQFRTIPPFAALFRLVDSAGLSLFELPLRTPLAKLDFAYLYGIKYPTFLLTEDFSAGAQSDKGSATRLVELRGGRFLFVEPVEDRGPVTGAFALADTIRSGWRIVELDPGRPRQIEIVRCYPNPAPTRSPSQAWITEYSVMSFDGKDWHRKRHATYGVWRNDGVEAWPERAFFPY